MKKFFYAVVLGLFLATPVIADNAKPLDIPPAMKALMCPAPFPGFSPDKYKVAFVFIDHSLVSHVFIKSNENEVVFEVSVVLDKNKNIVSKCVSDIGVIINQADIPGGTVPQIPKDSPF